MGGVRRARALHVQYMAGERGRGAASGCFKLQIPPRTQKTYFLVTVLVVIPIQLSRTDLDQESE